MRNAFRTALRVVAEIFLIPFRGMKELKAAAHPGGLTVIGIISITLSFLAVFLLVWLFNWWIAAAFVVSSLIFGGISNA